MLGRNAFHVPEDDTFYILLLYEKRQTDKDGKEERETREQCHCEFYQKRIELGQLETRSTLKLSECRIPMEDILCQASQHIPCHFSRYLFPTAFEHKSNLPKERLHLKLPIQNAEITRFSIYDTFSNNFTQWLHNLAYYIKNNEPAAPSPQLSCESPL
jgi:hypothetical protein